MPERPEFDATDVASPGGDGEHQRRWYHRLGPAVFAALFGIAALVAAIVTAPAETQPRFASPPDVTDVVQPPSATPTSVGTPTDLEPEVLGISEQPGDADDAEEADNANDAEEADDADDAVVMSAPFPGGSGKGASPAGEIIEISVNAVIVPSSQVEASIVNGALRSTWTFSGAAVTAIPGDGEFVTVDFFLTGVMRFALDTGSVLDLRCVEGDCPDGSTAWTSLPVGLVELGHAMTLIVRDDLAHDARFQLRSRPDPASYIGS